MNPMERDVFMRLLDDFAVLAHECARKSGIERELHDWFRQGLFQGQSDGYRDAAYRLEQALRALAAMPEAVHEEGE